MANDKQRKINAELLADFTAYCEANPSQRFWQALRNWSETGFIFVGNEADASDAVDTFYWNGRWDRGD